MNQALSYCRVSSIGQVEGHGFERQQNDIQKYASKEGIEIVANFQEVISGTVPVMAREVFTQLIEYGLEHCVKTILVASYDRFSRDLMVGEYGYKELTEMDFRIIPCNSPNHFTETKPENVLIRQVISSIAQLE